MDEHPISQEPSQSQSSSNSQPAEDGQGTEQTPMVLISVAQRNALIEYMAKQPYQDVANGIDFLRNAPVINVNLITDPNADA
jgi:hypothetical protein